MTDYERWEDRAACRGSDPAIWFPERGEDVREAKAVCATCTERVPCLALGMNEKFGIFGGRSAEERRQMRYSLRRRGAA